MATLQFKPDELLKKMRIRKYAVDQMIGAEPYSDRPLTPQEVEEKQRKQPGTSPYEPGKSPIPSRKTLASLADGRPDASIMTHVTEKGFFLDGQGKSYMQNGGNFYDAGDYNLDVHGLPVPLAEKQARNGLKIAHHTGGKHFTEPSMDELIQGIIKGDIPRGTLGDEETENRMIQEYLNKQKQSLKIGKA